MAIVKQNVGIDISKADFKANLSELHESGKIRTVSTRTFKNTNLGILAFLKWVLKQKRIDLEVRFTMEATGIYYESLAYFLHNHSYYVSVVLPNKSKAFAHSLNIKTKNDHVDAKMLGIMGLERHLDLWTPTSPKMRDLKKLCRERCMIIEEKTAMLNRLSAEKSSYEPFQAIIDRIKQRINFAKSQIAVIENQIVELIEQDKILLQKIEKVCAIKGVGLVTVATIFAETDGFALIKNRSQLVSYSGYDVIENQSGSFKGKTKISKKGNRYIRRALYFPAINVVKHEPLFNNLYERVFDATKIKMKGYVAVQRKLLIMIYTIFKKDIDFDSFYHLKTE